jgi:hypothetical protein
MKRITSIFSFGLPLVVAAFIMAGCPTPGDDGGPLEITGFAAIGNVSAGKEGNATYADAAAVISYLAGTYAAVTANTASSTVSVPVASWTDTDTYNPGAGGSYTFTAVLGDLPAGYLNSGGHTATVEVVVSFSYALGDDGPAGGKIFYVSETGFGPDNAWHYLEASPLGNGYPKDKWTSMSVSDLNTAEIKAQFGTISTGTAIGTGKANTAAILEVDPDAPAAKRCAEYSLNGYSDWFLPSKDELNELYRNRTHVLSGDWPQNVLWSSSRNAEWITAVWIQNLSSVTNSNTWNLEPGGQSYISVANIGYARPIRAF